MGQSHVLTLLLAPALLAAAATRPPRLVSINPCVDALLWRVADPGEIVAISRYSQDPRATSVPLAWARGFRATDGTAEELVALKPDTVLAGSGTDPATVKALRRLGVRLIEFPVPESVGQSIAQARAVAAIAGHAERGAALAGAIERAAQPQAGTRVPALLWREGGLVLGAGTLAEDLLARAGFRNVSPDYGLGKWGVLPLERLIARPPKVILSTPAAEAGGDRLATHRALRNLRVSARIVPFPGWLMNCGGPTIMPAMARLRAIRAGIGA